VKADSSATLHGSAVLSTFAGLASDASLRRWSYLHSQHQCWCQNVDLYRTSPANPHNAQDVLAPCEQKCLHQEPERSFVDVRVLDKVRKTVSGGRTSNGKSPAAICVQSRDMARANFEDQNSTSLAGQWDKVKWTARYWGARPFRHRWTMTTSSSWRSWSIDA